jgi:hypothetical protein
LPVVVVGMALQAGYRSRELQFIFGGRTYATALEARERFYDRLGYNKVAGRIGMVRLSRMSIV